jgi:hypothetical protein
MNRDRELSIRSRSLEIQKHQVSIDRIKAHREKRREELTPEDELRIHFHKGKIEVLRNLNAADQDVLDYANRLAQQYPMPAIQQAS